MRFLLSAVGIMTLSGSLIFLLFKCTEYFTKRYFNAAWHYSTLKCTALFFFIPFCGLNHILSMINLTGNVITSDIINLQKRNTTAFFLQIHNYGLTPTLLVDFLVTVWLTGIAILTAWQCFCLINFRNSVNRNKYPAGKQLQDIADYCGNKQGISKRIQLYVNEFIDTPMLIGFFSPIILLPTENIDPQNARFILMHEVIHFKNRDLIIKMGMLLLRTFFWFNPLVYILYSETAKWCEYTCDEKNVISLSHDSRKQYGRIILDTISAVPNFATNFGSPFLMPKQKVKERLNFMFNVRKMRVKTKVISLATAVMLMAAGMNSAFAAEIINTNVEQSFNWILDNAAKDQNFFIQYINEDLATKTEMKEEKLSEFLKSIEP